MIRNPLLAWSITVVAAIAAAVLGGRYLSARAELALLRDQRALNDIALKTAHAQIESEQILTQGIVENTKLPARPDLQATLLHSRAGTGVTGIAVAVCDPTDRRGLLVVEHLPPSAAGENYIVWAAGAPPIQLVQFTVPANSQRRQVPFTLPGTVPSPIRLLVSRESAGTTPAAPGTVVLASD